jgi:hypothetical protein
MSFTILETEDAPTIAYMKSFEETNQEQIEIQQKIEKIEILENCYKNKIVFIKNNKKIKELEPEIEILLECLEKLNRFLFENGELTDNDILVIFQNFSRPKLITTSVDILRKVLKNRNQIENVIKKKLEANLETLSMQYQVLNNLQDDTRKSIPPLSEIHTLEDQLEMKGEHYTDEPIDEELISILNRKLEQIPNIRSSLIVSQTLAKSKKEITEFSIFTNHIFLNVDEIQNINNISLFIGTYPYFTKDSFIWHFNSYEIYSVINQINNNRNITNSIYYFLDSSYDSTYRNKIIDLIQKNRKYHIHKIEGDIMIYRNKKMLRIEHKNTNVIMYIIQLNLLTDYNSRTQTLHTIDEKGEYINIRKAEFLPQYNDIAGISEKNKMSYSKNCKLNIHHWAILFRNLELFLSRNKENKFYLLNEAIEYGMLKGKRKGRVVNRYYEYFCELGFILDQAYQHGFGNQIYTIIPYILTETDEFSSDPIKIKEYHSNVEFVPLSSIYKYNFTDEEEG